METINKVTLPSINSLTFLFDLKLEDCNLNFMMSLKNNKLYNPKENPKQMVAILGNINENGNANGYK